MRLLITALMVLFTSAFTPYDNPRDPLGERASYQLDRNSSRTTQMIQAGTAIATVAQFLPDHQRGPSYEVQLEYDMTVQMYGRHRGTTKWAFSREFFDEEFMRRLRETGTYETPDYKIRHEGFADARNGDGGAYPHCDKILIYDVKVPQALGLEPLFAAMAGIDPDMPGNPRIEDLKIRAHVFSGVPVLGAVKLDLSGIVEGMSVKAGFDFKR